MAQLQTPFNAEQYNPAQGAGQMPLGRHPVVITESSVKANKNNDGGFVELLVSIIDGPAQGQTGAYRLNIYHANPQTVDIANRQLSALCHVTGQMQIQDTAQLHGHPFVVEVTNQKLSSEQMQKQAQGEQVTPYTQISKVFYIDGREPGKEGQAPAQAQTQPPAQQPAPVQQQAPAQPAAAWGAQPAPAAQPAGAAPAWGAQPAQTAQPATTAPAWQQGGAGAVNGATKPAWGR